MAPCALRSRARTGRPSLSRATTMSPSRFLRSAKLSAMQNTAMTSLAAVMTNPPWRAWPLQLVAKPDSTTRSWRSLQSMQRVKVIESGSIPSLLPWKMWLSIKAASRLFAAVMACRSPVKCRLMSSIGRHCALPPPVAPPLTPKTGPKDGSRSATTAFLPSLRKASAKPIVTVVLPSPKGVGLMAETRIKSACLPPLFSRAAAAAAGWIFPL